MSLYVVATPIGNIQDVSLRARELLAQCDFVVGEEHKEASKLLKFLGLPSKPIEVLNEHSRPRDWEELAERAIQAKVVLVSDCGTPGFCDPGAELVAACRQLGVKVYSVPGPSSLMAFLSVAGKRIEEFLFVGFLPANREERAKALARLKTEPRPVILMDTPYRLSRLLGELDNLDPKRRVIVGLELSRENEELFSGAVHDVRPKIGERTSEFVLLLEPASQGLGRSFERKYSKKK